MVMYNVNHGILSVMYNVNPGILSVMYNGNVHCKPWDLIGNAQW